MHKSGDHHYEECPEQAFSTVVGEEDGEVPLTVREDGKYLSIWISQALCCRYEEILGAARQFLQCW